MLQNDSINYEKTINKRYKQRQERVVQLIPAANKFTGVTTTPTNSSVRPAGSYLANRNNSSGTVTPSSPTSYSSPKPGMTPTSSIANKSPATTTTATQRLEQMKLNAENAKKNVINVPKKEPEVRTSILKTDPNSSRASGRPTSVAFLKMQELREKERQKRLMRMSKRQSKKSFESSIKFETHRFPYYYAKD